MPEADLAPSPLEEPRSWNHATAIIVRREPGPLTRSLVALSLRVALGMIFLTAGLSKLEGTKKGEYPDSIIKQFEGKPLRADLVRLFATVLPYAEVGIGAALILGLLTTITATLSAVLLAHLLFGWTVQQNAAMYPSMLTYILVNAGILWLSPVTSNYLSLDGLIFGLFWAPRADATFRVDDDDTRHRRKA